MYATSLHNNNNHTHLLTAMAFIMRTPDARDSWISPIGPPVPVFRCLLVQLRYLCS